MPGRPCPFNGLSNALLVAWNQRDTEKRTDPLSRNRSLAERFKSITRWTLSYRTAYKKEALPMPRKNQDLSEDQQVKLIEILNRRLANASAETMMQLPDVSLQEADTEALERWLDDGGTSDNQAV